MKRILITRPRSQADDFAQNLRVAGFEPLFFPVIEIQPIEKFLMDAPLEILMTRGTAFGRLVPLMGNSR